MGGARTPRSVRHHWSGGGARNRGRRVVKCRPRPGAVEVLIEASWEPPGRTTFPLLRTHMNNGQQRVRGHELIRTGPDARTWNYGSQGFGRGVPDPCQTEQPVTGSRRSLTETF